MKKMILMVLVAVVAVMCSGCAGFGTKHELKASESIAGNVNGKTVYIADYRFDDGVSWDKSYGAKGELKPFMQNAFAEAGFNPINNKNAEIVVIPSSVQLNRGGARFWGVLFTSINNQQTRIEIGNQMGFMEVIGERGFTDMILGVSKATAKVAKERLNKIPKNVKGIITKDTKELIDVEYED